MTMQVPVLIVGAGPVGLTAGLLLEQQGIDFRIVEQRPTLHDGPQAHAVSARALEICRSLGIDDQTVRDLGPSPSDTAFVRWVDRLVGRDLGVFSFDNDSEAGVRRLSKTPTPMTNVGQDIFESVLFGHLDDPDKVLFSHSWRRFESKADGYVSTIETGGTEIEIHSKYIIAADGAGSGIRRTLGIEMNGPRTLRTYMTVHFRANLRSHLAGREGLLYWVMDEDVAGVFIAHDIDSNWVYMKTIDADEPLNPIDEDKFAGLMAKAIGADVDVEIISMNPWQMSGQVAESYNDGRVFLVGDAAHRFPPTGGLGMNTGMQEAHNLIWKIAMVERGFDEALLETYELERKPVAEANTTQSVNNSRKMTDVRTLLDVDRDRRITMKDLDAALADAEIRASVQAAVDGQTAQFIVDGLDLGFCYSESPGIVNDGPPPVSDSTEYIPSTTPGARLPHVPLSRGGETISTLDLVRHDAFVLVASSEVATDDLVVQLNELGLPIIATKVGGDSEITPADDQFASLFASDQVLIVRPDGHIGARLPTTPSPADLSRTVATLVSAGRPRQLDG